MGNVRRYFRYDVEIPIFFETADDKKAISSKPMNI